MSDSIESPRDLIEQLMLRVKSVVPGEVAEDIRQNLRTVLQDALEEMEFVSREEFDIQRRVLQKTRKRVEELEQLVEKLEREPNKET